MQPYIDVQCLFHHRVIFQTEAHRGKYMGEVYHYQSHIRVIILGSFHVKWSSGHAGTVSDLAHSVIFALFFQ